MPKRILKPGWRAFKHYRYIAGQPVRFSNFAAEKITFFQKYLAFYADSMLVDKGTKKFIEIRWAASNTELLQFCCRVSNEKMTAMRGFRINLSVKKSRRWKNYGKSTRKKFNCSNNGFQNLNFWIWSKSKLFFLVLNSCSQILTKMHSYAMVFHFCVSERLKSFWINQRRHSFRISLSLLSARFRNTAQKPKIMQTLFLDSRLLFQVKNTAAWIRVLTGWALQRGDGCMPI